MPKDFGRSPEGSGRPQKNTIDFFPHFVNTTGKTKRILRQHFGAEGVAAWWDLLEVLAKSEEHYFDAREELNWLDLVSQIHLDEERAVRFLGLLARLGKIDGELWEERIIWSPRFMEKIRHIYEVSRKRPAPERPVFFLEKGQNLPISPGETAILPGERGTEKSRVEQSRVDLCTDGKGEEGKSGPGSLFFEDCFPEESGIDPVWEVHRILAEYERSDHPKAGNSRKKQARELLTKYGEEFLRQKIIHFCWLEKYHRERLGDNPAGMFVDSVRQRRGPPAGYEEWREQELKRRRGRDFRIDD